MEMTVNLTQHPATPDQVEAGVVDLQDAQRKELLGLLTFDAVPNETELWRRAGSVARLIPPASIAIAWRQGCRPRVMIGGAPFFMEPLSRVLRDEGVEVLFAFSVRSSVEEPDGKGGIKKTAVFKHAGFVEAVGKR